MQAIDKRAIEDEFDVYEAPSYRAAEVARILMIPTSTVKAWCFGQGYRSRGGDLKTFQPVIVPVDGERRLLSFANLCELYVLSSITRTYKIPLQQVRPALQYVEESLGIDRPLIERDFQTNGISLFLEHAGQLINVSMRGQGALRGDLEAALNRIERGGASGRPVRLFPFSRPIAKATEQPRIIAIDPHVAFGRPIVAPARVRTEVIIDRFEAGDGPGEMAVDYGVTEAEILEAVRFEYRLAA
jgi:uncharacterized protein (DUF433 family)